MDDLIIPDTISTIIDTGKKMLCREKSETYDKKVNSTIVKPNIAKENATSSEQVNKD